MICWNTSEKTIIFNIHSPEDDEPIKIITSPGQGIDFHSLGFKTESEIIKDERMSDKDPKKVQLRMKKYLQDLREYCTSEINEGLDDRD